jgi:hypothetical protein
MSITMGAFTGTLDFSVNNNNVTLSQPTGFSNSGTGTRTLNMGSGTWTLSAGFGGTIWDQSTFTNLTFNANTSRILVQPTATPDGNRILALGTLTYNNIEINDPAFTRSVNLLTTGTATITTLTLTNVKFLSLSGGGTTTVTNGFTWTNTASSPAFLGSQASTSAATLSVGGACTLNWVAVQNITKAGAGSITANNCLDLGVNSGITFTSPALRPSFALGV